jgi:hypothetical protein
MSRFLRYIILTFSIFFPALNMGQGQSETPHVVSFIELIANPAKYDGKVVSVIAFLGLDRPDGDMLYLHKEDYDHGILFNAVTVEESKQMWADTEKLDLNYVSVVGMFRSGEKSRNRYSGITNVTNCTLWSQPNNPIRQRLNNLHRPHSKPESQ